jgi:hypothetical protein
MMLAAMTTLLLMSGAAMAAEEQHEMVCRGTLSNAGPDTPDPYYTNVVWVGSGKCFFKRGNPEDICSE